MTSYSYLYMENKEDVSQTQEEGSIVYVVGAIIVVAVIVAAVLMWPKNKPKETASPTPENKVVTKPTLTKLVCESEWFNPVVGMPKYYLSAEGGDVSAGTQIECEFTLLKDKEAIIRETKVVPVVQSPERGGTTFKCTTKAVENIPQNTALTFVTTVKNEEGTTASCSGAVTFR
ncbi:MAG: hypothetical protein UV63_C0014G0018 [Microgenomates group bacterium GW2011_GWC1_43_11]|uniref:Uncharacterized protein n=2 Tax=Candidatus Gottesmaniibacteriota TaxID=1752720 RepID=A0A0G1LGS5_9BACT|nr:MAG: hypothetical protein UV63_C0014G0018 [Microgenomates group bacterium GW2011_GWC1_43_11]KKT33956.1 MAG: hypothetical protein UW22_C0086G0002 [Candidatus Gottesmanbacteria bacterium GW2011_GWB1_44_11c]KKT59124.1 MAG: hypothetical protein UW52_C0048G0007 [Candidatus Gottesmanbacteria bacterium GW2011_GWA1_44_24b]